MGGGGRPVVLGWSAPSPWTSIYRWKPQVLDYKSSNKTRTQNLPYGGKPSQARTPTRGGIPTFPWEGVAGHLRWSPPGTPPPRVGRPWWWSPFGTPPSKVTFFRTFLEPSRTFHKCTGSFSNTSNDILYMNLILRTIPELLVMSGISSGLRTNIRTPFHIQILPFQHPTLSVSPYGSRTMRTWLSTHSDQ